MLRASAGCAILSGVTDLEGRPMAMRFGLAFIILAAISIETQAADFKGCYERVYDKKYLRKNPKQKFIKMRFQIGVSPDADAPFELLDQISVVVRGKKLYDGNQVQCRADGESLACGLESDGGSFEVIDRGNNSIRVTLGDYLQLGDYEQVPAIKIDKHNKEFRLYRISKGACP
jgi:hypothetical protein